MSALVFLAIPVVIIAVGVLLLWLRHRKPTSLHSGVEAFQREMKALSPDGGGRGRRRTSADRNGRD